MSYSSLFGKLKLCLQFANINCSHSGELNYLVTRSKIGPYKTEINISRKNTGRLVAEYCIKFSNLEDELEIREWFHIQSTLFQQEFNYDYEVGNLRVYFYAKDEIEFDRDIDYSISELDKIVSWAFQKLIFMHKLVDLV